MKNILFIAICFVILGISSMSGTAIAITTSDQDIKPSFCGDCGGGD